MADGRCDCVMPAYTLMRRVESEAATNARALIAEVRRLRANEAAQIAALLGEERA